MTTQPFAIPAAAFLLLAVPLVLGLIPRNRFYGVRTAKALEDDRVWYPVNRVAGVAVMLASGVYGAVAVALPYDRSARDDLSTWAVHLAAFVVPIVLGLSVATRYARSR
jgi:cytochrome bd-type quinol oxidase subunit 2